MGEDASLPKEGIIVITKTFWGVEGLANVVQGLGSPCVTKMEATTSASSTPISNTWGNATEQGEGSALGLRGGNQEDVGREKVKTCLEPIDLQIFFGLFLFWKTSFPKRVPTCLPMHLTRGTKCH